MSESRDRNYNYPPWHEIRAKSACLLVSLLSRRVSSLAAPDLLARILLLGPNFAFVVYEIFGNPNVPSSASATMRAFKQPP